MTEKYDAVLAHVYMYKYDSKKPRSGIRGHIQVSALSELYRQGAVNKIFIAGGSVWGEEYPPLANVMADELVRRSVKREAIVVNPAAIDTPQEVDLFLQEAKKQGWINLADVANKNHRRVIKRIYRSRKKDVSLISAENVLDNVRRPEHSTRPYPYRKFLEAFRNSWPEKIFKIRGVIISALYFLGLERRLSKFASKQRNERFEPSFDK